MTLVITGGSFKGQKLKAPSSIRPTFEKLRKAVFDMCQQEIEDARFLDIYAGSGAMGLEALSRGALHTTFIEKAPQVARCLKENIQLLKVEDQVELILSQAMQGLKTLQKRSNLQAFDLIYIDPPYGVSSDLKQSEKEIEEILHLLDESLLIKETTRVFVEFSEYSKFRFEQVTFKRLHYLKLRHYGMTHLHEFEIKRED